MDEIQQGESSFTTIIYARKQHKEEVKQKKTRIVKNGFLLGGLAGAAAAVAVVIAAPVAIVTLGALALEIAGAGLATTGLVGGGVIGMYIAG